MVASSAKRRISSCLKRDDDQKEVFHRRRCCLEKGSIFYKSDTETAPTAAVNYCTLSKIDRRYPSRSEKMDLRNHHPVQRGNYSHNRWICILLLQLYIFVTPVVTQPSLRVGVSAVEDTSKMIRKDEPLQGSSDTCRIDNPIFNLDSFVCDSPFPSDYSLISIHSTASNSDDDRVKQDADGHSDSIFMTLDHGNFTKVLTQSCKKDSFLLVLIVFYTSSSCLQNDTLFQRLEGAAPLLQTEITVQNERFRNAALGWESSLTAPLYVKVNVDELSDHKSSLHTWLRQFDLGKMDEYPKLRLVQMEDLGNDGIERKASDNFHVHSIAFMGSTDSTQDIIDGVMHYLCRLTLSAYYYVDEDMSRDNTKQHSIPNLPVHLFPSRLSVFAFSTEKSFHQFLQITGQNLYHNVSQVLSFISLNERAYAHPMITFEEEDLKEPFFAFIQCRSVVDPSMELNQQVTMYDEFEALAEVFIHRRDVAFFIFATHQPQECEWFLNTDMWDENRWDGAVRVLKIDSSRRQEKHYEPTWSLGATYFPTVSITKSDLSMKNFVVFQSTPSVLWYDRFTSAIWAFHLKRKIHVVLFIDMHSPSVLNETDLLNSYERSRLAVKALRTVAMDVKRNQPQEDIVFLMIPSTEIRIMRTLGIDIWSPMDEVMMGNTTVGNVLSHSLPKLVITSRNESPFYTKRYSLGPEELMKCNVNNSDCDSQHTEIAIGGFLTKVFEGTGHHDIKSQNEPVDHENDSGVITLTGHSFHSLMSNLTKNTLIQFYAPWCGHCKRFQVIWNKLARLVRYCNIQSTLDVMKIDLTENDVYHPFINIQAFPSVYYFSKAAIDRPIKLNITGDTVSSSPDHTILKSPKAILDWVLSHGKIDRDELLQLLNV